MTPFIYEYFYDVISYPSSDPPGFVWKLYNEDGVEIHWNWSPTEKEASEDVISWIKYWNKR